MANEPRDPLPPPLPPRNSPFQALDVMPDDYPGHGYRDLGDDPAMRLLLPVGRSGWAIAAGYAGLFALLVIPAPIAVILSLVAIADLRRHPEKRGWGRTIFGLSTGIAGSIFLLTVVLMLVTVG